MSLSDVGNLDQIHKVSCEGTDTEGRMPCNDRSRDWSDDIYRAKKAKDYWQP